MRQPGNEQIGFVSFGGLVIVGEAAPKQFNFGANFSGGHHR